MARDDPSSPWRKRARAAGLTNRFLSQLTGFHEVTVARQLGTLYGPTPRHVKAIVVAWEIMNGIQRAELLHRLNDDDLGLDDNFSAEPLKKLPRRRRGSPRKSDA